MSKILISNGNIGSAAAGMLLEQGHEVYLLVRKPSSGTPLDRMGIKYRVADSSKPATLPAAFEDIQQFFFISPLVQNMVELAGNLLQAAKAAGVRQIVRSSANGASASAPVLMGKMHGQIEDQLKSSGIPYTILRPATFFQNLLSSAESIRTQNSFFGSSGNGKNALVDVRDIAAVAMTALTEPGHLGKTYTLTGSEALSNADIAGEISRQTGRSVQYVDLPAEKLAASYKSYGMDDWAIKAYLELDDITKQGFVANVSSDVLQVIGKPPIALRSFIKENLASFK